MQERAPFAGGDQTYLRNDQYGDTSKLEARTALHHRFSTATVSFPDFEAALTDWPGQCRALDCGTGSGRFWDNKTTPRTASLTLTDLSPGMVEAAALRAATSGFTTITTEECDIQSLPFDDATFDVVLANHMLYHVPDPDQAIRELARVLTPDGVLLASTNGSGHMDTMKDAIAEAIEDHGDKLYEVFGIDTGEWRLRESFSEISWHAYDNDLLVTDLDAAVAYGLSFPPGETATAVQANALRAALERRFVDGVLRIRTRTGAFVCRQPRQRAERRPLRPNLLTS